MIALHFIFCAEFIDLKFASETQVNFKRYDLFQLWIASFWIERKDFFKA